jgi:hypothetical protein
MEKIKFRLTIVVFTLVCIGLCTKLAAQKEPKGLLKTGTPASAVITKLWQTPLSINGQPVVGLVLQVTPPIGNPFVVQIHKEISLLQTSYYQPGSIVQVRYDPTALPINPEKPTKKVVIESLGGSANPTNMAADTSNQDPAQMAQYTAALLKTDSLRKQLMISGVSSKAVILAYKSYKNLKVNGNNPAVTLDLQVIPDDKASFKATVEPIVILESSIPKYQPGKIIFVKYDPNDLTKVMVDHSQ